MGDNVGRAGAHVVARAAGPEGVLVELDAFAGGAAEDHGAEPAAAHRQGLLPLCGGLPIPEAGGGFAKGGEFAAELLRVDALGGEVVFLDANFIFFKEGGLLCHRSGVDGLGAGRLEFAQDDGFLGVVENRENLEVGAVGDRDFVDGEDILDLLDLRRAQDLCEVGEQGVMPGAERCIDGADFFQCAVRTCFILGGAGLVERFPEKF